MIIDSTTPEWFIKHDSRVIFLDRDGTINKLPPSYPNNGEGDIRNYVTSWSDFHFLAGALDAIRYWGEHGYNLYVVSNQSCIGRGLVDASTIWEVFDTMRQYIWQRTGVSLAACVVCPHAPDARCACRKPKPGLLYYLAVRDDICLADAWMIGDSECDIDAGHAAGCKTVSLQAWYQRHKTLLDVAKHTVSIDMKG